MTQSTLSSFINNLVLHALDQGFEISVHYSFASFKEVCTNLEGKEEPVDFFLPENADGKALWICGRDRAGQIVHVQAIGMFETGQGNLADYFAGNAGAFLSHDHGVTVEGSIFDDAPCTKRLAGRFCYHGENWLHPSLRAQALTMLLPRLAIALGHQHWSPDYIIGLLTPFLSYKGMAIRYGYPHCMSAIHWYRPGDGDYETDWMCWMNSEDVDHLIKQSVLKEQSYFAGRGKKLVA